jgi:hypothetical protein
VSTGRDIINSAASHYGEARSPRASGGRPGNDIPHYGGLLFLGWLYVVLGFICFAVGGIAAGVMLIGSIAGGFQATRSGMPPEARDLVVIGGFGSFVVAGMVFICGMIQIGFGQLMFAIRDMAQNSFWLRQRQAGA